jgi:predicted transport protein
MADIKLFKIGESGAFELQVQPAAVERSLQTLIEHNLELLLGIRMLKSEYFTGRVHNGRIDTLGLDEDNTPVIIEYKRRTDENVINQGLFYLDWLLDHKAEFQLRVLETLGEETASSIDWNEPRLICIAGDFTRYDEHAVQQIQRSIDLVRYRRYGEDLLLLELANGSWAASNQPLTSETTTLPISTDPLPDRPQNTYRTFSELVARSSDDLKQLWLSIQTFLTGLGDDVQVKQLKYYVAFRRLRNFASVEVHPVSKLVTVFVKLDINKVSLEDGFSRDVRDIGHYGTGNVELTIRNEADFEKAKPLMTMAYAAE